MIKFRGRLKEGRYIKTVRREFLNAQTLGVDATPISMLGYSIPGQPDKVRVVTSIRGAEDFGKFDTLISQMLANGMEKVQYREHP